LPPSRGYLGPTVAFSGLTGTRTNVNPQTVRDITVGFKSQLFNRAVTSTPAPFLTNTPTCKPACSTGRNS
jgi:iron complex outermembrane receptor protein